MSQTHDDHATRDQGYGAGGRSNRPLLFLIPIGFALILVLALFAEGINVMTTPSAPAAGERNIVQTAVPAPGPAG
ncbi:MAG TPA: hypothetical protein VIJ94_08495 [Caulobacteraceae bacterium]